MSFPWFRFYTEWVSDPKVQTMPFAWQRHMIAIFCWHATGELNGLDDTVLAASFHMTPQELGEMKAAFRQRGFISKQGWAPKNWEKRQQRSDSSSARTKAYRDRLNPSKNTCDSHSDSNVTVTRQSRNGRVTAQDKDRDKDRDKDKDEFSDENSSVVVVVTGTHAGENADENKTGIGDPLLACIDALVPEIDNTWPDANWGAQAYDFCKAFPPPCVVYGFRTCIAKAWKGETVNLKRVRSLIEWAKKNAITLDQAIAVPTRESPAPKAKERPKTAREERHDAAVALDRRMAEKTGLHTLQDFIDEDEREKANKKPGDK